MTVAVPGYGADGGAPFAPIFLGQIEVENRAPNPVKGATSLGAVDVTLLPTRRDGKMFAELVKRTHGKPAADGSFRFDGSRYPISKDAALPRHLRPSFLLDFDEPSVLAARKQAVQAYGERPSVAELAQFVARYIDKKNMERAFDIASQVAARKEGDCTEHAVLLAAVLRAFGHAARVVQGLAIVVLDGSPAAFGHAWVEYHDGAVWKPADAALTGDLDVRYVPLQVIEDEGPAFERHMLETTGAILEVRRILLDPPARTR